ncbi:MAG: hypothetical protein ACRD92_02765 [Nitrosopumilaceae archaeon]
MNEITIFQCKCQKPKMSRLTFDGGSSGQYVVEICQECYKDDDKKFLVSEERLL